MADETTGTTTISPKGLGARGSGYRMPKSYVPSTTYDSSYLSDDLDYVSFDDVMTDLVGFSSTLLNGYSQNGETIAIPTYVDN